MAVRCAALTATASSGLASRNDPRARPQGSPRRKPRRAGLMRGAGEHQHGAALVFVGHGARPPQRFTPQGWPIDEGFGADAPQNARRSADVGEPDRPAQ